MPVILNLSGAENARTLIGEGKVSSKAWSFSFEDGTALLGPEGKDWNNYAKHFLAEDTDAPENSRERFKYPIAKNGEVSRTALMSVRNRASQETEGFVYNEAKRLMESVGPRPTNGDRPLTPAGSVLQFKPQSRLSLRQSSEVSAELDIFGVIGGSFWDDSGVTKERFAESMKQIAKSVQVLNLRIDSPGGDVFDGRSIANMLRQSQYKVNVNIIGEASSAASIIAMAGDNVHMSEGSLMLVHRCYTLAIGNSLEMAKISQELNVIDQEAVATYQRKTKMSKEDIISLMDENRYMTAEEALSKGFADTIDSDTSATQANGFRIAAAVLSDQDRSRLHLPPLPENYRPNRKAALNIMERFRG